jgi:uncharacterized membrane protein
LLIAFRIFYSGTLRYVTLGWNIFLAWIPYALSNYFVYYRNKEKWKQLCLFSSWLLFFPNALYIVTDLVHLREVSNMPWWFDSVLVFSSSVAGLIMAFVSLSKAEFYLRSILHKKIVIAMVSAIIFLGSFGVYLGRFHRWNSWDVLNNPVGLGIDIFSKLANPVNNYKAWAITVLFSAVYSLLYYFLKMLPRSMHGNKNTGLLHPV